MFFTNVFEITGSHFHVTWLQVLSWMWEEIKSNFVALKKYST